MVDASATQAPALSTLQLAWLREIGIDKRMLARFATKPAPEDVQPAAQCVNSPVEQDEAQPASGTQPELRRAATVLADHAGAHSGSSAIAAARALLDSGKAGAAAGPARARRQSPGPSGSVPQDAEHSQSGGTPVPHNWQELEAHILACQACELHTGRSHVVHGAGQVSSPAWMLIGEAPGERDDRVGLPFQGKAGVLLHAMLAAVGVRADSSVFFTNLVKCRPLGSRTPLPGEISACQPYLMRQIALLQPQRIVVLGRLAAQALLGVDADLEPLRGKVHVYRSEAGQEIPLIVTYHPASLLTRPQHKANAWRDLHLALAAVVNE